MASISDPIAPKTWVAIDIAKGFNVVLVEHDDGRQQRFRFAHTREDYDRLVAFCRSAAQPCRIAFEPTADYHRTLGYRLVSEGFDVVFVSSVAGARLREVIFNSWDKNDPKDATVILRLLKSGMTQRYCDPVIMKTHDLQELSKTYHHIARARTRLQHLLLTHYFTLYWPEIERFWTASVMSGSSSCCCGSRHRSPSPNCPSAPFKQRSRRSFADVPTRKRKSWSCITLQKTASGCRYLRVHQPSAHSACS